MKTVWSACCRRRARTATPPCPRGGGHQGERRADTAETANVQIEVILKPAVAEALLLRLQQELFPAFAMVAYESDVRVLRPDKF